MKKLRGKVMVRRAGRRHCWLQIRNPTSARGNQEPIQFKGGALVVRDIDKEGDFTQRGITFTLDGNDYTSDKRGGQQQVTISLDETSLESLLDGIIELVRSSDEYAFVKFKNLTTRTAR